MFRIKARLLLLAGLSILTGGFNRQVSAGEARLVVDPAPVPILAYHHVVSALPEGADPSLYVTADQFARQMDILLAYDYQPISLEDFLAYRSGEKAPPQKPVMITFDDGYEDNYSVAFPILKGRELKATLFLPTGKIAEDATRRFAKPGSPAETYLIWPEVVAMAAEGISFGSHTVHHSNLNHTGTDVWAELSDSLLALQAQLTGYSNPFFAYPYGLGDTDEIIALLEAAGYQAAVDYPSGDEDDPSAGDVADLFLSDLYDLPRRKIGLSTTFVLNQKNPSTFFMRRLNPDFPLPFIDLGSDVIAADSIGLERRVFEPGELVTVTVLLDNWGSGTPGCVRLQVLVPSGDPLAGGAEPVVLDSLLPGKDKTAAVFLVSLPETAAEGRYSASVQVEDPSGLLSYYTSEPFALFSVGDYPVALPLIFR